MSLAEGASKYKLSRPLVTDENVLKIFKGRYVVSIIVLSFFDC